MKDENANLRCIEISSTIVMAIPHESNLIVFQYCCYISGANLIERHIISFR